MELNIEEIMEILPHRYPMLLVDKITELVPMDYAVGVKSVTINEPFFRDISPATPSCLAPLSVKPWHRSAALLSSIPKKIGASFPCLQAWTKSASVPPSARETSL